MSVLEIRNIRKRYSGAKKWALDDVSFSIPSGSITAILGHNGAGKSTLLNIICGGLKPSSGGVFFDEYDISRHEKVARRVCAYMPQTQAPIDAVTPRQALRAIAGIRGCGKEESHSLAENFLESVGIIDSGNTRGDHLSGGLHRLVSLGMALVQDAPVYLLDEPTNDVDPIRRGKVWAAVRAKADAGAIVVVVTHNVQEVQAVADQVLIFHHGQLVADSETARLAALSSHVEVRVTSTSIPERVMDCLGSPAQRRDDHVISITCSEGEESEIFSILTHLMSEDPTLAFDASRASVEQLYALVTNENDKDNEHTTEVPNV